MPARRKEPRIFPCNLLRDDEALPEMLLGLARSQTLPPVIGTRHVDSQHIDCGDYAIETPAHSDWPKSEDRDRNSAAEMPYMWREWTVQQAWATTGTGSEVIEYIVVRVADPGRNLDD